MIAAIFTVGAAGVWGIVVGLILGGLLLELGDRKRCARATHPVHELHVQLRAKGCADMRQQEANQVDELDELWSAPAYGEPKR